MQSAHAWLALSLIGGLSATFGRDAGIGTAGLPDCGGAGGFWEGAPLDGIIATVRARGLGAGMGVGVSLSGTADPSGGGGGPLGGLVSGGSMRSAGPVAAGPLITAGEPRRGGGGSALPACLHRPSTRSRSV